MSCSSSIPSGTAGSRTWPSPTRRGTTCRSTASTPPPCSASRQEISDEFGTDDWEPLILQVNDDYPRSLAAYRLADVLLVNPIRDGMNLVAKEGPVLSRARLRARAVARGGRRRRDGPEALLVVNPFDVSQTAEALHQALLMPSERSAPRCERLAAIATALPPQRWLADQLAALDRLD